MGRLLLELTATSRLGLWYPLADLGVKEGDSPRLLDVKSESIDKGKEEEEHKKK